VLLYSGATKVVGVVVAWVYAASASLSEDILATVVVIFRCPSSPSANVRSSAVTNSLTRRLSVSLHILGKISPDEGLLLSVKRSAVYISAITRKVAMEFANRLSLPMSSSSSFRLCAQRRR
jgi:hypothetical protein